MPDMSGLIYFLLAAVGGLVGTLLLIPMAIASIWIDGLMTWSWVPPVAGMAAGIVWAQFTR